MKIPSWLYLKFVMALGGVCHGSVSNPSWLWEDSITCWDWLLLLLAISHPSRLLSDKNNNTYNCVSKLCSKLCLTNIKFNIRHEDFFRLSIRQVCPPPPEIWNGIDWRALVKSRPPYIGGFLFYLLFFREFFFLQSSGLKKSVFFLKIFLIFWIFWQFLNLFWFSLDFCDFLDLISHFFF